MSLLIFSLLLMANSVSQTVSFSPLTKSQSSIDQVFRVHNLNTNISYVSIQAAIDASETLNGHTILADAGIYNEHVIVHKSLTLKGKSRNNTAIDVGDSGHAVHVVANNVTITRFKIQKSGTFSMQDLCVFVNSSANSIIDNTIEGGYCGVATEGSNDNTIANNTILNSGSGLVLWNSNDSVVAANEILNCPIGLAVSQSSKCLLRSNSMINCTSAFGVSGTLLENFLNEIDISNTIDGKPVYYLLNQTNLMVNPYAFPEVGSLTIINSTNVVVENLMLTNSGSAVQFAFTSNSLIKGIVVSNNTWGEGISLYSGINNTVFGCNISDCFFGIDLSNSSNCTLKNNIISNSGLSAVALRNSTMNLIVKNDVIGAERCIDLIGSENNTFHHNNFMNYSQFYVDGHANVWDDGVEGNYWSSYTDSDLNHDGIGNSFYIIDSRNRDNYPLMGMFYDFNTSLGKDIEVISNSTVEGFEYNTTGAIRFYVSNMTTNQTFGFCRICIPHELTNVTNISVVIDDGATQILYPNYTLHDNGTHGWIYFAYAHSTRKIVIVSEFPSFFILALFMTASLLAVIVYKRKGSENKREN